MYIYIAVGLIVAVVIWTVGSYLIIRNIETPRYTIVEKRSGYELRKYEAYIVAETVVEGDRATALNRGFSIIADYIFGNNVSKQSIAMTAPVLDSKTSETIAVTAPVLSTKNSADTRTVAFVLPSTYTLETLPTPNNPAITLRLVDAHLVAVHTFSWYATPQRVERKTATLLAALAQDNLVVTNTIQVAQYNPPLSMPLIRRNEIMVWVK